MGAARFGVPVGQLAVSDGVITVKADPSKKVTYGELIGGKKFNVTLTGNNIDATTGVAKVKPVQELKAVDENRIVTSLGRQIASLHIDPRLARMLIAASHHGCLTELIVIAAFLAGQDPR